MSAGPKGFVAVAKAEELAEGHLKGVRVGDQAVVLAKVGGQVYALSDICSHELAYMHEGDLEGEMLVCPAHFSGFNVKTGQALQPPADQALATYAVRVEEGQIWVSTKPE